MLVLFEDHHLLAVSKPARLMTQAPAGVPSLEAEVKAYIKDRYAKPAGVHLGIPHRLDRPVSGVVVFCRNTKAAQRIAEQFQTHAVTKVYWALAEGVVAEDAGEWRDFVRKVDDQARAEIVPPDAAGAKEAVTAFRVLRRDADATLLELTPRTGRMHQLRVQAAARGHPVVGDALYGSTRPFGPPAELPRDRVIALHARRLAFDHPFRHQARVELEAPVPDYWNTGSATADASVPVAAGDCQPASGTLTFAPGETTKTITIEVQGDNKRESDESFYLDLFGTSGNTPFTKNRSVGTILNDD